MSLLSPELKRQKHFNLYILTDFNEKIIQTHCQYNLTSFFLWLNCGDFTYLYLQEFN